MRVRVLKVIIFCILFVMCNSGVYALNLFGPPNAELEKGQFEYGLEHSYSRRAMDFGYDSGTGNMPNFGNNIMRMDTIYSRLSYGFSEKIEGFASAGWARIVDKEHQRIDVDGRIYGVGAKYTLSEYYLVKWGVMVQADIVRTDGTWYRPHSYGDWYGDVDLNYYQILVAGGANYQLSKTAFMYGGPFCYYLDGRAEYKEQWPYPGWIEKYDLENKSMFGWYVGMQMLIRTDIGLNLEYQRTSHDNMLACGFLWKFR